MSAAWLRNDVHDNAEAKGKRLRPRPAIDLPIPQHQLLGFRFRFLRASSLS